MKNCYCGNARTFEQCCAPFIFGIQKPSTAEELMRSRYSAYAHKNVDYLVKTTHPNEQKPELASEIRAWMNKVQWMSLRVIETRMGLENHKKGYVRFVADYLENGEVKQHEELSLFKKFHSEWYYVTAC